MSEEVLSWLLPGVPADERAGVRRVIAALRLLRDDARVRAARRAPPTWARARGELEDLQRRRRRAAIETLLHAHLCALRSADSFLDLGACGTSIADAWRTLLAEPQGAPLLPAPGEAPAAVIERLLTAGAALAPPPWRVLWEGRRRHVLELGPARHWKAAFEAAREARAGLAFQAGLLGARVAACLESFLPARAWEHFEAHAPLAALDPGLRRLFGWSALSCGDVARARELLDGAPAAPLPRALVELREDSPELNGLLPGPALAAGAAARAHPRADRKALGAALLAVVVRQPDGRLEFLSLDARGARSSKPEGHARDAQVDRFDGRPLVRLRRSGAAPLPLALGGESIRALALVAVRAADGDLAGWVQLESEHWLLPPAAILGAHAEASRAAILAARRDPARARPAAGREVRLQACPVGTGDPRHAFVSALFGACGSLAGRRAYWIECAGADEFLVLAERGGALHAWGAQPGGGGLVRRALEQRATALHHGEREQSIHSAAASGFALPLWDAGDERVLGLLVLESPRHEPLDEHRLARLRGALEELVLPWWAGVFRAAHLAHFGLDLSWDPRTRSLESSEPDVRTKARSREPVLLVGQAGSGRRTLAHWLHLRGLRAPQGFVHGARPSLALRVFELGELSRDEQRELARTRATGERWVFLGAAPAHVLRARGALEPELERRLDPLPLLVPPLCERRDEIPALVRVLAANAARRASLGAVRFSDEALGHLWRQDWPGNVSELARLVAELAHAHAAREVDGEAVRANLRSHGSGFRERLPSLRPHARDIELALETTRHRIGSLNRARAARYLGWDADTLAARLREREASLSFQTPALRPAGEARVEE